MEDFARKVFERARNKPMHTEKLWLKIQKLGYVSRGKSPWASLASKLGANKEVFERVAPSIYRLRNWKSGKKSR
jgi:hypothetical protein